MYCLLIFSVYFGVVESIPVDFNDTIKENVIQDESGLNDNKTVELSEENSTVKRQVILPGNPFFLEPIPNLDLPDVLPTLDLETQDIIAKNGTKRKPGNYTKLIEQIEEYIANQTKNAKQELETSDEVTSTTEREYTANQESEESAESEEEPSDFVQALIKSFLGQLSTPEGGVDVDAVVGLIGGLSVPNDDGTYDFSGLTETLQSFLDPGDGTGGSDVGAFLGGLIGAFIQGVAKPPGAKGSGILAGNLVAQILPALSAPAPPPEGSEAPPKQPKLDIGSFLGGFLKTFLSASSGGSNGGAKEVRY